MKIAVIGSGMAGLAAARIMQDAGHQVYVFEALQGKGMDSHSLDIEGGIIDSPLRVMNPSLWKQTLGLAKHVGIDMFQVNTYMSCNWLPQQQEQYHRENTTWLTTSRTRLGRFPIINDAQLARKYAPRLIKGWLQCSQAAKKFKKLPLEQQQQFTLAQFINTYQIDDYFWHGCMMPVLYTLCTCDAKTLGDWTAKPLIEFIQKMNRGESLLRMKGGTHGFVEALSRKLKFYSGAKVTQVECLTDSVIVHNVQGISVEVDKVIVATPTHVIDFLDEQQFSHELTLLRKFRFSQGELVIHTDENCMPQQKKHWSALSYLMDKQFNQQMFSVWLNAVEPTLRGKQDIFQSWNPTITLDPAKIIDRVKLTRAIVDIHTAQHSQQLKDMQQQANRQIYFCGSWFCDGLPVLESAVTSAIFV
ncbi:hypothetical protein GWI33_011672, partial [Rhynchophorus ferrugineus]